MRLSRSTLHYRITKSRYRYTSPSPFQEQVHLSNFLQCLWRQNKWRGSCGSKKKGRGGDVPVPRVHPLSARSRGEFVRAASFLGSSSHWVPSERVFSHLYGSSMCRGVARGEKRVGVVCKEGDKCIV